MSQRFNKAREYTKIYKNQLMPCKYCGNTDIYIVSDRTIFNPRNVWSVMCGSDACDCITRNSVKDAVKTWNARHKKEDK